MSTDHGTPGVIAPPPIIFAVPLGLGLLADHFRPWPFLPDGVAHVLGPCLFAPALIGFAALFAFRRAGTNPEPWKPATALVTSGPYRFTRNPMYIGMSLIYAAVSVWANALWPLFLLPVALVVLFRGVVAREEAYLERVFGEDYRAYKARVRRWI